MQKIIKWYSSAIYAGIRKGFMTTSHVFCLTEAKLS